MHGVPGTRPGREHFPTPRPLSDFSVRNISFSTRRGVEWRLAFHQSGMQRMPWAPEAEHVDDHARLRPPDRLCKQGYDDMRATFILILTPIANRG